MSSHTFHFNIAGIEIYSHFSFNLAQYSGVNNIKTMLTSLKVEIIQKTEWFKCSLTCGGYRSSVHSTQAVKPGIITRALPLNPKTN